MEVPKRSGLRSTNLSNDLSLKYSLDPTVMWAICRWDPCVRTMGSGGHRVTSVANESTITYGSMMKLFVKDFKKDPHDETMAINACIVGRPNADFDGESIDRSLIRRRRACSRQAA